MKALIAPFQILFLPTTLLLLLWMLYRIFLKKDKAAGLVLILALVVIVDQYMIKAIFIPGLATGSIRFDELVILYFLFVRPKDNRLQESLLYSLYIRRAKTLFIIYLALYFINILRGGDAVNLFFTEYRRVAIMPFLVFLIASRGFDTEDDYKRFGVYLLIYAIVLSLASIQMMLFDRYFIKSPVMEDKFYHVIRSRRFGSFYGNPNHFGGFLVLVLPLFISLPLIVKRKLAKMLTIMALIIVAFAFFKTYSRGSFLGLAIGLAFFLFAPIRGFTLYRRVAMIGVILLGILVFAPNLYQSIIARIETIEQETVVESVSESQPTSSRAYVWINTLKVISQSPILGVGVGLKNYREHLEGLEGKVLDQVAVQVLSELEHPHNSYLYIAVFFGVLALAVFLLFIINFYRASFYFFRDSSNNDLKLICFAITCGISGFLCTITFDYQLFVKGSCLPLWILMGINLSFLKYIDRPNSSLCSP